MPFEPMTATPTVRPTRRQLLLGAASAAAGCAGAKPSASRPASVGAPSIAEIEAAVGGRIGVFALDTGTNRTLDHRANERFAMCSTFKWVLAAAILGEVDHGRLSLDERVPYGPADLLDYAPVARVHVAEGAMTVEALAAAAVTLSDNTAANLLLPRIGGPAGLTAFVRACGDPVTRLDRNEPSLNSNLPGDPRDTTSPRAMAGLMRRLLCDGDALTVVSRDKLLGWLRGCQTCARRLRAGLPATWVVGDKTGSGSSNALNDVAIATPPGRAPVLIACYTSYSAAALATVEAAHAQVGRLIAEVF
jgi:beta-lactamase class A